MSILWWLALLASPPDTAVIETIAGTGKPDLNLFEGKASEVNVGQPFGVELGPDGALYICEVQNHRVMRLDLTSQRITTVAGNGKKGYSGDGGKATDASLNEPYEVRFDGKGSMYFVEMMNAVVRKVDHASGTISTVAGTGKVGFSGDDGPAVRAELRQPHSIALDAKDGLYIADIGNHRIRRVDLASGLIDTIAGNGEARQPAADSVATGKPILGPRALSIQGGTMWIALREGNSVWTMDLASRTLRLVAGSGKAGFADASGRDAAFNGPKGIAVGTAGFVYVADTENQAIRRVGAQSGAVSTVAGSGPEASGFGGDGGAPRAAKMDRPHGIAVGPDGTLYIGDTNNHRVRRVRLGKR